MHAILATIGTSLLAASSAYRGGISGAVMYALGLAALAVARRQNVPMLRRIPGLIEPGTLRAAVTSVALLLIGIGAASLVLDPVFAGAHPLAAAAATLISGLAMFGFDAKEIASLKAPPGGPVGPTAVLLLTFTSCAWLQHTGGRVIQCSGRAVADHVAELLPAVKQCLASQTVDACLSALVQPAKGITLDVVACVVHGEVSKVSGPGDLEAGKRSEAGREWLRANGFTVAGE